ncbi:hypothetical protein C0991_006669 [Blastosporella zonata]|nr:hypothetical protein C0991_006669 [Blastosporella zonata]
MRLPMISGTLAFANLCYAIICTFVVLDGWLLHPSDDDHDAGYDAICAGVLFGAGCVNYIVAGFRTSESPGGWAITVCFLLAGNLNHATGYLFLKAKLTHGIICSCRRDGGLPSDLDLEKATVTV